MKKALIWTVTIVLLDLAIGALAVECFDIIGFAQKYNQEIVYGILFSGLIYFFSRIYKRLRFQEKTQKVRIQLLEV